jgi:hypothetical protein
VTKWEYQTEIGKFEQLNDLIERLNQIGAEGWEAVSMTAEREGDDTGYTVLLKREKREGATGGYRFGQARGV